MLHVALLALASALFMAWPEIDLKVAALFFRDGQWIGSGRTSIEGFRQLAAVIVFTVPVSAVLVWIVRRATGVSGGGRAAIVLGLSLAVGPGLLVNAVLKENWGRARPSQIVDFGRDRAFTPVLMPANECTRNCSFASGEVAMVSSLLTLAWLSHRLRWLFLLPGLLLGIAMGVARMSAGAHFLSDTIFAGLIASATGLGAYWMVYRNELAAPATAK